MKPEYKKKSIRSFVIRAGRMTEGQKNALETWWPNYGLSLFDGKFDSEVVFGRRAPLVLEIGFGMGDSLLQMAKADPGKDYIGIEVHPPGVGRLISCAGNDGVKNLKVFMADAIDVLEDCIPDESLERMQLFFPDPWHKKKHNKRRILQPNFIEKIRTKLKAGGVFHMATDWEDYADDAMEKMSLAKGYKNTSPDYLFSAQPEYRPTTKFERRGERLGHGVWDILFEKI